MKKSMAIIFALVAIGAGFAFYAFQDPVRKERLEQLQAGMTKEQVKSILGAPSKEYPRGQWTYKRALGFGYVNIHWKADGTYDGQYNYERF